MRQTVLMSRMLLALLTLMAATTAGCTSASLEGGRPPASDDPEPESSSESSITQLVEAPEAEVIPPNPGTMLITIEEAEWATTEGPPPDFDADVPIYIPRSAPNGVSSTTKYRRFDAGGEPDALIVIDWDGQVASLSITRGTDDLCDRTHDAEWSEVRIHGSLGCEARTRPGAPVYFARWAEDGWRFQFETSALTDLDALLYIEDWLPLEP